MEKINEENYISLVISNLSLLRCLFDNEVVPSQDYDGDREDKMDEIDNIIKYLNKTN